MISDEQHANEEAVRLLYSHITGNNGGGFADVVSTTFEDRSNGSKGPHGFAAAAANLHRAYADLKIHIVDMVLQEDLVVVRWVETGQHVGPFFNLKPTGKPFEARGLTMYRLKDGKIVESWLGIDPSTVRAQQQGQEALRSGAGSR